MRRGLLNPIARRPVAGRPWWRAVNDATAEGHLRGLRRRVRPPGDRAGRCRGHLASPGPDRPGTWYRAHNTSIASAYLANANSPGERTASSGSSSTSCWCACCTPTPSSPRHGSPWAGRPQWLPSGRPPAGHDRHLLSSRGCCRTPTRSATRSTVRRPGARLRPPGRRRHHPAADRGKSCSRGRADELGATSKLRCCWSARAICRRTPGTPGTTPPGEPARLSFAARAARRLVGPRRR